ncbi:hypothetical protein T05_4388 [Trichinella murrelli]|uniref:Uncharacterized protein n=1 Tax=Trichinella murrelli TaxID=144512 RepID=A0A0V0UG61_9BILA|nr:hypothetical protein T05_4388 [Trichinella murrelli]
MLENKEEEMFNSLYLSVVVIDSYSPSGFCCRAFSFTDATKRKLIKGRKRESGETRRAISRFGRWARSQRFIQRREFCVWQKIFALQQERDKIAFNQSDFIHS